MSWQKILISAGLALVLIPFLAGGAFAQNYGQSPGSGAGSRAALMIISVGFGLLIGYLSSSEGKDARTGVLGIGGFILVSFALGNSGLAGWSAAVIVAFVGFFSAIGFFAAKAVRSLGEIPTTFGSSRWATTADVRDHNLLDQGGVRFGGLPIDGTDTITSYHGDRHLLTVAPTRSGKGTTQIVPNLLTYEGSVLVIDPKGENAMITAQRRKNMGQDVHIVDPWGIVEIDGLETSRLNPLDWLRQNEAEITENAMILADALVVGENHSDAFWVEEAKALLQGFILYVATDKAEDGQRHLGRVRDLLLLGDTQLQDLFKKMQKSPDHVVASTGARCLQKERKLLANVLASAQAQTHFLDSAKLQANLRMSDFAFEDLKTKPTTIYLVLPADRLNTFGRWLRLLVQQAVTVNARNIDVKPDKPVLFILDEFAALGRLSMIEQAFGLMAGFGIQLWGIVQDLSQLERIYDKGWQSFIANAGMINYFGSTDKMTAEYFSAMCGETTVWNFSSAVSKALGTSSGAGGGSSSDTMTQSDTRAASQRKLIYPDELMRLQATKQIAFIENMHPLIATKTPWFEDDSVKSLGVNLEAPASGEPEAEQDSSTAKDVLVEASQ